MGPEYKYKSQEVFSYLALVFEDSFQTTLLMSLSQSYSNTYRELAGKWIDFIVHKLATKEVHVEPNNTNKMTKTTNHERKLMLLDTSSAFKASSKVGYSS